MPQLPLVKIALVLLVQWLGVTSVHSAPVTIDGAIANHVKNIFQEIAAAFTISDPDVLITFNSTVSSVALQELNDQKIDFAITQNTAPDVSTCGTGHVTFPIFVGVGGVFHNVPEILRLQLSACNLADIFSGSIKMWNHPNLLQLNPGLKAVAEPINVVIRESPGSVIPLTEQFQAYVTRGCATAAPLYSTTPFSWPAEVNYTKVVAIKDVVEALKSSNYTIGYFQSSEQHLGLREASVENKNGEYVTSSEAELPGSIGLPLLNQQDDPSCWGDVDTTFMAGQFIHPLTYFVYFISHRFAHAKSPAAVTAFAKTWLSPDVQGNLGGYGFMRLNPSIKRLSSMAVELLGSAETPTQALAYSGKGSRITEQAPEQQQARKPMRVVAIVSITCAVVISVILLATVAFLLIRRRRAAARRNRDELATGQPQFVEAQMVAGKTMGDSTV